MVRMAGSKRRSEPLTAVTIKKVKRNTEEVAKKMVAPLSNVTITKVKKDYEIDEEDEVVEMDEEEEVVEMEEETMQEEEVTDADLEEVKEEDVDEVKYDDDSDSEELVVDEDVQDDEESKADIEYLMNEEEEIDNNGDVEVIEEEPIVKEEEVKVEEAKVQSGNGWESVDSLPAGWKFREIDNTDRNSSAGKRQFILSPTGKIFPCRRLALKYMVEQGFAEAEVSDMRSMLGHEGWVGHQLLPEGWLAREERWSSSHSKEFISPEGVLYKTFKQAVAVMRQAGVAEEVLASLEVFQKGDSRKVVSSYDWKADPSLPEGWKIKGGVNCQYFLSPSGERQFSGRRMALQYMIQNNHSEEDRTRMREAMAAEGWMPSQHLPHGWIVKKYEKKGKSSIFILSKEGHMFKSCKNAMDYMKLNSQYDEADLDNLAKIYKKMSNEKRKDEVLWMKSETLPEGWKMRIPPGSEKKFFLSPDGQAFYCRRLALLFMIQNHLPKDEVEQMRSSMKDDGWSTSPHLPEGWIYKVIITSAKQYSVNINILSEEGAKFESYLAAIKHMEASAGYDEADVEGINRLLAENTKDWRKSAFIPENVKVKIMHRAHFICLCFSFV